MSRRVKGGFTVFLKIVLSLLGVFDARVSIAELPSAMLSVLLFFFRFQPYSQPFTAGGLGGQFPAGRPLSTDTVSF